MMASGPMSPSPPSPGLVSWTLTRYLVEGCRYISLMGSLLYTGVKGMRQGISDGSLMCKQMICVFNRKTFVSMHRHFLYVYYFLVSQRQM